MHYLPIIYLHTDLAAQQTEDVEMLPPPAGHAEIAAKLFAEIGKYTSSSK